VAAEIVDRSKVFEQFQLDAVELCRPAKLYNLGYRGVL
jgi:hypothetical protein